MRRRPPGLMSSSRIRALLTVIAVMVALTAGWPLLNLAVSDHQPLPAGARLSVGPNRAHSARFMVGAGWSMISSQSNPRHGYSLRRGPVAVSVKYVTLSSKSQAGSLWTGLQSILRAANASARLTKPALVTDAQGGMRLTGFITENGRWGTATVFSNPAGGFAIEMVVLAPRRAISASRAEARQLVRSMRLSRTPG